ncbi:MAG: CvpA family protein [Campylobacterota bacterium]|nr:CvpA family protein [Campylobacterota bacterium]
MDLASLDFNYFDVTIGAIVVILGIKGFMNGFVKEFFGLAGLVGGVYIGSRVANSAAAFIDKNLYHMENPAALKLIGFISILAIIWLGAVSLGALFSKLTYASGLGFINRLAGFIVGGGKYFLIFALIITALSNVTLVKDNMEKYVSGSILYPYLKEAGSFLINIDPDTFQISDTDKSAAIPAASLDGNLSTLTGSDLNQSHNR